MPAPTMPVESFQDNLGNMVISGVIYTPTKSSQEHLLSGTSHSTDEGFFEHTDMAVDRSTTVHVVPGIPTSPSTVDTSNGDSQDVVPPLDPLTSFRMTDIVGNVPISRDSVAVKNKISMETPIKTIDTCSEDYAPREPEPTQELSPLLQASKSGDLMEVHRLISEPGTDLLRRDPKRGETALHFAVREGHLRVVQALCDPKIVRSIIDATDNMRNTALHVASMKSRRITKVLLDAGASVEIINMRGQSPLSVHVMTAKKDDPIMVEMLLQQKANPNMSIDQTTPLHLAIDANLLEISCRLVRHGARLDAKDENGKMVFDKVSNKTLRKLIAKITYPPVWIPNDERTNCMLCPKKFSIGNRRHHCRHCGRLCCADCTHNFIASVAFPKGFNDRLKPGAKANEKEKRVCKTCFNVIKERQQGAAGDNGTTGNFYDRVVNIEWDEVQGQVNAPAS